MKGKKQTCQLLMTQTGKAMKKIVLRQEASRIVGTGRFYIKLFMSICTREHSSNPTLVSLFFSWNFTFIVARYCIHIGVLFFFCSTWKQSYSNEFHRTQEWNFFTAHIVTQMSEVIWFDFIILLYSTILLCKHCTKNKDFHSGFLP